LCSSVLLINSIFVCCNDASPSLMWSSHRKECWWLGKWFFLEDRAKWLFFNTRHPRCVIFNTLVNETIVIRVYTQLLIIISLNISNMFRLLKSPLQAECKSRWEIRAKWTRSRTWNWRYYTLKSLKIKKIYEITLKSVKQLL
jgi:hypothetical protein